MEELVEQICAEVIRSLFLVRMQRGLTYQELADRTGLDRSYIGLLEKGKRRPTLEVVLKLSIALDAPLTEMLTKVQEKLGGEPITPTPTRTPAVNRKHVRVGAIVRRYRRKAGQTQEELALKSGLSSVHISQIERDKVSPTLDDLNALCESLDINLTDITTSIDR